MPIKTGFTSDYLRSLQSKVDKGDYKNFWTSLAQNGDTYADNAAVVTGAPVSNITDRVMQDLVKVHWDNTAGPGQYEKHFSEFAVDHAANYLSILKQSGNYPSTSEIVDSYNKARLKVNIDTGATLPATVIFDGVWEKVYDQIQNPTIPVVPPGAPFFPKWNTALTMEPGRDDGTPDIGVPASLALPILLKDASDLGSKYAGALDRSAEGLALNLYNKLLDWQLYLNDPGRVSHDLPSWLSPVQAGWNGYLRASGPPAGCPLVLDLGTTGVTLSGVHSLNAAYWDIDKDGYREASAWVSKDDGLLAIDKNGNGKIDDQGELFGDQSGYNNGFQALAVYDTNHDGKITAADVQFSKLLVWVDANGDAVSQPSELRTLNSLGITSINLSYTEVYQDAGDGNTIRETSTFTIGGATRSIVDAWFAYDNVNTSYNGSFALDPKTLLLPDLRGYGNIPALHVAMSLDPVLLTLVQDLTTKTFAQLLDPAYGLQGKLAQIMYQWGGTTSADPNGPLDIFGTTHFDNRQLQFMQKLMGQAITTPNPWGYDALQTAFKSAMAGVAGDLLLQSGLGSLYKNPSYNLTADSFTNADGSTTGTSVWFNNVGYDALNATANINNIFILQKGNGGADVPGNIDRIQPTADGHLNTIILSDALPADVRMWYHVDGSVYLQYSDNDRVLIGSRVSSATGASLLPDSVQQIVFSNGTVWDLTKGLPLTDTDDGHSLTGSSLNDTIDGRGGNDQISGAGGNDIITGGTGQDGLYGGPGYDTYVFRVGDSPTSAPDCIVEREGEGIDTIKLTGGILPTSVSVRATYGLTYIKYSATDTIVISGGRDTSKNATTSPVEKIAFDDGTVWSLADGITEATSFGAGGKSLPVSNVSPLFDEAYYLAQNPDVSAAGLDPYQHFMTTGWKEGRDPSALFSTSFYLAQYPAVKLAGVNPLTDFETTGWKQGRDPSYVFSTSKYLNGNPDVRAAGINPLVSYLRTGAAEGRPTYAVLPASNNYAFTNASTNTSGNASGDTYTGPVSYLQSQFIWSGPGSDNVAISTAIPNVFLKGGAGGDALAVRGGSNVLDGGGGSNFLVGGNGADKGADTFFVDSRGGVVTWSTIVNFHPGDMATIFGFRAGVSTKPYTASDGAAGYTGVTIHSEIDGPGTGIKASMTFAGIDQATAQAHFVTTYGVLPGNIDYMLVQYQ